ncbi:MAG: hypothetical protein ABF727_12985 [Gluconobacter oxydans]
MNGNENLSKDERLMHYKVRRLDKSNITFSTILANMEGGCGKRHSPQQFKQHCHHDAEIVIKYLEKARTDISAMDFIAHMVEKHSVLLEEDNVEKYQLFLEKINHFLVHPLKACLRFKTCQEICTVAEEAGINRYHVVVLVSLASVCGFEAAKNIIKPKEKLDDLNTYNAINDIMVLSRIGTFKAISKQEGNGATFAYLTLDKNLEAFLKAVRITDATATPCIGGMQTMTTYRPLPSLFPSLTRKQFFALFSSRENGER